MHWVDITLTAIFLFISLGIGLYQAIMGKQNTIDEFLVANRQLKLIPTALSHLTTLRSSVTILGAPAEIYNWGTQMWFVTDILGYTIAAILSERFIVPLLFNLKIISTWEYLEQRFKSKAVRRLASCISILCCFHFIGVSTLSSAIAMEGIVGLPFSTSVYLTTVFCTVYTALGGMRGVVWNDVFQAGILYGGLIFILAQSCREVGDIKSVFNICIAEGRLIFAKFTPNPTIRLSFWSSVIGFIPNIVFVAGFQQVCVQRYVSLPSLKKARQMMLLYIPFTWLFALINGLVGLAMVAYFAKIQCDPIKGGLLSSPNQIYPFFVKQKFQHFTGTNGLILLIFYSSTLSTVSSALSGNAANTWEDFLAPLLQRHLNEYQATIVNKVLVIVYGALGIGITFLLANLPGNIMMMAWTLSGAAGGPLIGIFLLGGLIEKAEWIGALAGGIFGFLTVISITAGSWMSEARRYQPLPPFSTTGCHIFHNQNFSTGRQPLGNFTALSFSVNDTQNKEAVALFYPVKPLIGLKKIFEISPFWCPLIGTLTTIFCGFCVSTLVCYFTGGRRVKVQDKYLIQWRKALWCTVSQGNKELHASPIELDKLKEDEAEDL